MSSPLMPPLRTGRPRSADPRRAFTLVEIVVVVIIVALLAAIATVVLSGNVRHSRETALDASLKKVGETAAARSAEKDTSFASMLATQAAESTSDQLSLTSGATSDGHVLLTAKSGSTVRYQLFESDGRPVSAPTSTSPAGYRPYAAMVLAAGPAVYLPMDNGSAITDLSGHHAPVTVYGPPGTVDSFVAGGPGSVRFKGGSGSGEMVQFPGSAAPTVLNKDYTGTGQWTLEAWIRLTAAQINSSELIILGKQGCHSGLYLFRDPTPATTRIDFAIKTDQCWTNAPVISTHVPNDSQAVHVVGTYDGRTTTLWVNGQKIGTGFLPAPNTINQSQSIPFMVGSSSGDMYKPNVDVQDVAVYERVLSDAEIRQHYRAGL